MNSVPEITIEVRHSADCAYKADPTYKRCKCRKGLRYFQHGKSKRVSAKTRSWALAEKAQLVLSEQLSGKPTAPAAPSRDIRVAIELYLAKKRIGGVSTDGLNKAKRLLDRLAGHCEALNVLTVDNITGELIIGFMRNWQTLYPSAVTRSKVREFYMQFMKHCRGLRWIVDVPEWPKVKVDAVPTLPLSDKEYAALLDAVYVVVKSPADAIVQNQTYEYWTKRVRGLFVLMRWSGLSITDALTLRRSEVFKQGEHYRVVTQRTKTGTDVSVALPPVVAEELFAIPNDNDRYFFWSGTGKKKSISGNWGKRFIVPCFEEAGIDASGWMKAHRLRDTFACHLLQRGVPLEEVSKLLGHSSIKTTEKSYAAWVPGRQDRLDALVSATWDSPEKRKRSRRSIA